MANESGVSFEDAFVQPKKFLLCIDGSDYSDHVFAAACSMYHEGDTFHFATVRAKVHYTDSDCKSHLLPL